MPLADGDVLGDYRAAGREFDGLSAATDGFDGHSHQRHKDEHHNVGNCEDAMVGQLKAEAVQTDDRDNDAGEEGRYKGRADMQHVCERREPEDVGISMEHPEENQVEKKG